MGIRDFLRPLQAININTVITGADLTKADVISADALDGDAGGTYSNKPIWIGGAGISWTNSNTSIQGGAITCKGGRFVLGANDAPTFSPARTRVVTHHFARNIYYTSRFTLVRSPQVGVLSGGPDGSGNADSFMSSLPQLRMHQAATLTQVVVRFRVTKPRTVLSPPGTTPSFTLVAIDSVGTQTSLGVGTGTWASADVYFNGGKAQSLTLSSISPVIATDTHSYLLELNDEGGANSFGGNIYHSAQFTYTVNDMKPQ